MKELNSKPYLDALKEAFAKSKGVFRKHSSTADTLTAAEQAGLLFHGSPYGNLLLGLLPVENRLIPNEKVLFAGKPWVGVSCTVKWDDRDFRQGTRNNQTQPYMQSMTKHGFDKYVTGGYVYGLSPESFEWNERLTGFEFISFQTVKPIFRVFVKYPIAVMTQLGVSLESP